MFKIARGTPCHIRRVGSEEWRPFTTTRALRFNSYEPTDNGGRWLFRRDGWELKVISALVDGRKPKQPKKRLPRVTCGIPTGRGVSRRRRNHPRRRR
jgi:hypothetical protein